MKRPIPFSPGSNNIILSRHITSHTEQLTSKVIEEDFCGRPALLPEEVADDISVLQTYRRRIDQNGALDDLGLWCWCLALNDRRQAGSNAHNHEAAKPLVLSRGSDQ